MHEREAASEWGGSRRKAAGQAARRGALGASGLSRVFGLVGLVGLAGLGGCASPFLKASGDYAALLLRGTTALGGVWPQSADLCRARTGVDFLRHRLAVELQEAQAGTIARGGGKDGAKGKVGARGRPGETARSGRDWLGFDAEADAGDAEAARLALLWRARCEETDRAVTMMEGTFAALRAFAQGLQTAAEAGTNESGLGVGLVKGPADSSADLAARLDDKVVPQVAPLKTIGAPLGALAGLAEPGYSDRRLREIVRKSHGPVTEILGALRDYLGAIDSDAAEASAQLKTVAQASERHLAMETARAPAYSAVAGIGPGRSAHVLLREYVQLVAALEGELGETRTTIRAAREALGRLVAAHAQLSSAADKKDRRGQRQELARFATALSEADTAISALRR